jgi:hypothetical protein
VLQKLIFTSIVALAVSGCAALGELRGLVQVPHFEQEPGRQAEIRLLGPSGSLPAGGAGVRIWTRVSNPNPFGLTLGALRGTLHLENSRAADVDFPLGLPLRAREESTIRSTCRSASRTFPDWPMPSGAQLRVSRSRITSRGQSASTRDSSASPRSGR